MTHSKAVPAVLVIDNVDSFTFTLVDYLRQLGAEVAVVRSTEITVSDALAHDGPLLISPGPGRPEEAGISVPLAAACLETGKPLLGVCLGHQAIALAAGARIVRAAPVHGKTDPIHHDGSGLFAGLPSPLTVTRYHSLVAEHLPEPLLATAHGSDGTIQGLRHRSAPIHGVQFHPESVASEHGLTLLGRFLEEARQS
ncbi:aminodeoxychorismate/anthranilate synthase component II [Sphingomonas swuensis]|uniref:Aminodeoxychorismate/anthranilate synthase component II n=1 Tax=Sphingomonas swuensis TaxID=977800 RepID=A0ABP7T1F6_9SPHN